MIKINFTIPPNSKLFGVNRELLQEDKEYLQEPKQQKDI